MTRLDQESVEVSGNIEGKSEKNGSSEYPGDTFEYEDLQALLTPQIVTDRKHLFFNPSARRRLSSSSSSSSSFALNKPSPGLNHFRPFSPTQNALPVLHPPDNSHTLPSIQTILHKPAPLPKKRFRGFSNISSLHLPTAARPPIPKHPPRVPPSPYSYWSPKSTEWKEHSVVSSDQRVRGLPEPEPSFSLRLSSPSKELPPIGSVLENELREHSPINSPSNQYVRRTIYVTGFEQYNEPFSPHSSTFQPAPSAHAFTDSGYGSSIHDKSRSLETGSMAQGYEEDAAEDVSSIADVRGDLQSEASSLADVGSIYSDGPSLAGSRGGNYIEAFAEDISNVIRNYDLNEEALSHVSEALPGLLRDFALGMGHGDSTQMHRDVMVFLHKYRREIATTFSSNLCTNEAVTDKGGASEKMDLDELITSWHERTEVSCGTGLAGNLNQAPELIPMEPPEEVVLGPAYSQSGPSNSTHLEGGDADVEVKIAMIDIERTRWEGHDLDNDEEEDDDDYDDDEEEKQMQNPLHGIPAYTELIQSTPAYCHLLASLQRECFLAPSQPNVMELMRNKILKSLLLSRKISRKRATETCQMVYTVKWDAASCFRDQEYSEHSGDAIGKVITLTGSTTMVQALTCGEYLRQTWPTIGTHMLQLMKDLLCNFATSDAFTTLPDGTKVRARYLLAHESEVAIQVTAFGPANCIAEIGELLAWLGAALRSSPYEKGVAYSLPLVKDLQAISLQDHAYSCSIDFSVRKGGSVSVDSDGQCWHGLFRNPVVVEGYPILRRSPGIPGIEISLQMMAGLIRTTKINPFAKTLTLKGLSSILVPTDHYMTIVTWHLVHNKFGGRVSYLAGMKASPVQLGMSDLERVRHIVGWCSQMKLYAGAPDAPYGVKSARLPRSFGNTLLAQTSISVGQSLTGGRPFIIGRKDRPAHVSRNCYARKLRWVSRKFVVLWDEGDKRGWLVNGASALLHLVRASLDQEKLDKFFSVSLFNPALVQESSRPYEPTSALDILLNSHNLRLKIYEGGDSGTTFQDQVEGMYDFMEKMIDHQIGVMQNVGLCQEGMSRAYLEGWDFNDLATERDPIYPRLTQLDSNGKAWVDFTRSINAITLFGRGFGEIIQPANTCLPWARLPKGKSYLAACQGDLEEIMDADGDPYSIPRRLTDTVVWHMPDSLHGCKCKHGTDGEHSDLAQVLLPSSMYSELSMGLSCYEVEHGSAFIFGFNENCRWFWNDRGDPIKDTVDGMSSLFSPQQIANSPYNDSGIGISLISSTSKGSTEGSTIQLPSNAESLQEDASRTPIPQIQWQRTLHLQNMTSSLALRKYTVGIICALHTELMAVRALFDADHDDRLITHEDPNSYALGRMARHSVVAACLPDGEYGTNPAADVAANMKRTFPAIKFCLLVGIGGGVPSDQNDIRLGDVVVSKPCGENTGVLPYDMKKTLESGRFQLNGYLQAPPRYLLSVLSEMKSDPKLSKTTPLDSYLQQIIECDPDYMYPGKENDWLFKSAFPHPSNSDTCRECHFAKQAINRAPRPISQPKIHYGTIASGNQVMKNAQIRDQLGKQHDVLCFEMEAAGIMNIFPSLIIRGICDYADSHKNKMWQKYAATATAAFTKLLLSRVRTATEIEHDFFSSFELEENSSRPKRHLESASLLAASVAKRQRISVSSLCI